MEYCDVDDLDESIVIEPETSSPQNKNKKDFGKAYHELVTKLGADHMTKIMVPVMNPAPQEARHADLNRFQ